MNKIFFGVLGATAITLGTLTVSSVITTAQAQKNSDGPIILTIAMDTVIAQSKAGQAALKEVEDYQKSVAGELTAEQASFQKEVESFQQNQGLWAADVRQKKEQELRLKQAQLPRMAQAMESVFQQTVQKARFDIGKEAEPILQDIADDRKATLIIDRSTTYFAATETDITQEVLSKLDKKVKSISVEKYSLADLKKQAEDAQKNAKN